VRALKFCGFRKAAIGLAAARLPVLVLVMAPVFFTVAASMPPALRAAKCRRSPADRTNASRFMTGPRAPYVAPLAAWPCTISDWTKPPSRRACTAISPGVRRYQ
jgi:hypothetical protein